MIRNLAALVEMRPEQRKLQLGLLGRPMFLARPGQQLVSVESVPHPALRFGIGASVVERHTGILGSFAHAALHRLGLFGGGTVFARDMCGAFLALGRHIRIEFEGMPANVRLDLAIELFEPLLQGAPADQAPGAHDIGPDIDPQGSRLAHLFTHHCMR